MQMRLSEFYFWNNELKAYLQAEAEEEERRMEEMMNRRKR